MSEELPTSVPGGGATDDYSAVITEWRLAEWELVQALYEMSAFPSTPPPEGVEAAFQERENRRFAIMYGQLTPGARAAEAARLNAAAGSADRRTASEAARWNTSVAIWHAQHAQADTKSEDPAGDLAAALTRCTYRGGLSAFPDRAEPCRCEFVAIGSGPDGVLRWSDRSSREVCAIRWAEVLAVRVGPADRGAERVTVPRAVLARVFALAVRKGPREAMIAIRTPMGEAIFIVHGHTPLELEAKLAPFTARTGSRDPARTPRLRPFGPMRPSGLRSAARIHEPATDGHQISNVCGVDRGKDTVHDRLRHERRGRRP